MKRLKGSCEAFSLIELSISMAVIAILTSSIIPIAIRSFQIKAAEKTALEVIMIQDASRNYYRGNNFCINNSFRLRETFTVEPSVIIK